MNGMPRNYSPYSRAFMGLSYRIQGGKFRCKKARVLRTRCITNPMFQQPYSQSFVVRNSSKEPESGPSPEDTNYPRKSLRNLVKIIDFLRNSRPLEKSREFLK